MFSYWGGMSGCQPKMSESKHHQFSHSPKMNESLPVADKR